MARRERRLVQRLARGVRSSPWILIAIGLHVILGAALSVVVIQHGRRRTEGLATSITVAGVRPVEPAPIVPEPPLERAPIPAQERVELVPLEEAEAYVLTAEAPPEIDWREKLGDPTGSEGDDGTSSGGTSIGVGPGGRYGTGKPSGILGPRPGSGSGAGAPGRTSRSGQPLGTEEAVLEGLRWLMRHQEEDGSWSAASLHARCVSRTPCIPPDPELDSTFDVGMTALALLAFLGHGISVGSRFEIADPALGRPAAPAGEVVKRGIRWLIERQASDGSFSGSGSAPFALPENDTLPTMVLCEAHALARGNTKIRRHAQRALDFLVLAQRRAADGTPWGWGVGSQRDLEARRERGALDEDAYEEARASVDPSITCWVVMALRSAQSSGFRVADGTLAGALAYAGSAAAGAAAFAPADPRDAFIRHPARADALGMLIRTFAGGDVGDPWLARAAGELAADPPRVSADRLSVDFYYWYFATLALEQYDGPESPRADRGRFWEPWNEALVEALLALQDRSRRDGACARGGWLQEARGNRRGRALYNTALNVLTLEVYYRFENVFGLAARSATSGPR